MASIKFVEIRKGKPKEVMEEVARGSKKVK